MTQALNIKQEIQRDRKSVIDKLDAWTRIWTHGGQDHHREAGRHG